MTHYSKEEKIDFFKEELGFIKNPEKREFAIQYLNDTPDYFFDISASSSGKYHPGYAARNHGLVLHTKAAMQFLQFMTELEQSEFTEAEKDLLIIAVLVHDTAKRGITEGVHTLPEHPLLAAERIRSYKEKTIYMTEDELEYIASAVSSHMGQWNTDYKGNVILPKPVTPQQKIVHLADYLASRKRVEFIFEEEWANESTTKDPLKSSKRKSKDAVKSDKTTLDRSKNAYADMYAAGKTIVEIANIYGVKTMTAENNVLEAAAHREDISLDDFIDPVYEASILKIASEEWDKKLRTIKEKLPDEVSYLCIKAVLLKHKII